MTQRILVLLGHPSSDSFCHAMAQTYAESAREAGHEVRILKLGEMAFDPILREGSPFWDRLLTGRSAHIFVTMDTPPFFHRWIHRQPGSRVLKRHILEFSGIRPVKVSCFGPVKTASPARHSRWLARVGQVARRG